MKNSFRQLSLWLFLFISFQTAFSQPEDVKKELQQADAKYLYGKKYEEAKSIYLKHIAHLTPQ